MRWLKLSAAVLVIVGALVANFMEVDVPWLGRLGASSGSAEPSGDGHTMKALDSAPSPKSPVRTDAAIQAQRSTS